MERIKTVTVYCASSAKVAAKYFEATEAIANLLVDHDIAVRYGGGSVGLMGKLADTMVERGGVITGIMPSFMHEVEWQHKRINQLIVTKDMHERKKLLIEDSDALISLPGGCGTLEELLEAITLKRLGIFVKPIIIFNLDGFYDPLLDMLERCIAEQFMRAVHRDMWTVISQPEELLDAIHNAPGWESSAINFAAV